MHCLLVYPIPYIMVSKTVKDRQGFYDSECRSVVTVRVFFFKLKVVKRNRQQAEKLTKIIVAL